MIRIKDLTFSIGNFRMNKTNLHVAEGEYFVLLGQPGSGKSILLECLCGLNKLGTGKIYIAGKDITHAEPRKRSIGYVPQDYALFPHLSVERNISFGLHGQGLSSDEIAARVDKNASVLGIKHLLKRRVRGLSGGEKQRTALARALAIEPRVLLLDEPVSALDESTRDKVCMELRGLQTKLGITTIHVSHNLEEAFSVADHAAILRHGTLEQVGTPSELLYHPKNSFVAQFMRCGNLFAGHAKGPGPEHNTTYVEVQGFDFVVPGTHRGNIEFMIRPENIHIQTTNRFDAEDTDIQIPVKLVRVVNCGSFVRLNCSGAIPIVAHMLYNSFAKLGVSDGDEMLATVAPKMIHVLSSEQGSM